MGGAEPHTLIIGACLVKACDRATILYTFPNPYIRSCNIQLHSQDIAGCCY